MSKNDYWKLSAFEGAKLIRDGSISAEDLVSSCIERVNQTNNKINAIVDDLREPALEKAHELDKLTKKGKFQRTVTWSSNYNQRKYRSKRVCNT